MQTTASSPGLFSRAMLRKPKAAELVFRRRSSFSRYSFATESHRFERTNFNWRTIMLGEKLGEMSGKINSQRVLAHPVGGPKMETTSQADGPSRGIHVKTTVTH